MTATAWDSNQILTLVIAAFAALVAMASAIIGIVALVQSRAHFGQPNWSSFPGAVWSDPFAQVTWRVENLGPREAMDVIVSVRPPRRMTLDQWRIWRGGVERRTEHRSDFVGQVARLGVQDAIFIEVDATTGQGQISLKPGSDSWESFEPNTTSEPLYGKWRFRLEWRAAPKPQKVRRKFHIMRIKRSFKQTHIGF